VGGDVQGVFFRDSCKRVAQEAGVAGWARNNPDGRVEVILEGDRAAVERVTEWCREGPRTAYVDSVEVQEEEPKGETGFSIR
jgi:acylphosphatase